MPSTVANVLFGVDEQSERHQIRLTKQALDLVQYPTQSDRDRESPVLLHLEAAIESGQSKDPGARPDFVARIADVLKFLPNREHYYGDCRFVATKVDDVRYAILAHGPSPEHEQISRLRDDAVMGALGDIALLMQTSAVKLARDRSNQLRYMGHQLSNDFAKVELPLLTLSNAIDSDEPAEAKRNVAILQDKFNNLRCLTSCLLLRLERVTEFGEDILTLLRKLTKWQLSGLEKWISPELDLSGGEQLGGIRFPLEVTRDIFLVFNNLLSNAIQAAAESNTQRLGIQATATSDAQGETVLILTFFNSSRNRIGDVFRRFLENDDRKTDVILPLKNRFGDEHLGLWTVRQLLFRNGFGRARVGDWKPGEGDAGLAIEIRIRIPPRTAEGSATM